MYLEEAFEIVFRDCLDMGAQAVVEHYYLYQYHRRFWKANA